MAWAAQTYDSLIRKAGRINTDHLRNNSHRRGYGKKWQAYRKRFLALNPWCACGCGRIAEDVDHIIPVKGPADPLFWDPTNHQGLTHSCHSKKTAAEDGGFGRARKGRATGGGKQ